MDFQVDSSVDGGRVALDRKLSDWYREIARRGGIPDPGTAAAISPELRDRYRAGVAGLLAKAASETGVSLPELYRVNRGLIPPWAWHRPYQRVRGIATPVPGKLRPGADGAVRFSVSGVEVTILPDGFDPVLRDRAETRISWRWEVPGYRYAVEGGTEMVTAVIPGTRPGITIQTFYSRDVPADGIAGYGRGNTKEDVAGAAVHPWSATVAFHEGQHGMDCLEFLREKPVPGFSGRADMTVPRFNAACGEFGRAWSDYQKQASAFTWTRTDAIGAVSGQRPHLVVQSPATTTGPAGSRGRRS